MIYSNPRFTAIFTDWPYGTKRTTATFQVETHPTRGQRCTRVTLHPLTGRASAPKATTYARRVRIVDGDDGRTYVVSLTIYGTLSVMDSSLSLNVESLAVGDPRYEALRAMLT